MGHCGVVLLRRPLSLVAIEVRAYVVWWQPITPVLLFCATKPFQGAHRSVERRACRWICSVVVICAPVGAAAWRLYRHCGRPVGKGNRSDQEHYVRTTPAAWVSHW
jgi:hypothetical protein